jgi:hypothetical protein
MKRKIILGVLSAAVLMTFTACAGTDVVGKVASTSFEAIINKIPDQIKPDDSLNGWALTSPAGDRFIWSKDFSGQGTPDVMVEFDSKPFIDAGLDVTKLPQKMVSGDKIVYTAELGSEKFSYKGDPKPIDSFKEIVRTNRDVVGYHQALDHYGISLGEGNMFEWAKDMKTNDKDIVFVLNPQPFIDADVKPDAVEGWAFAKVEVMMDGKTQQVDKLLRPFDLK